MDPTLPRILSLYLQRSASPPFWQSASSELPQKGLSPARAEHHHSTCQNSCLGAWACTTHAPASCGLTACLSLRPPFPSLLTFYREPGVVVKGASWFLLPTPHRQPTDTTCCCPPSSGRHPVGDPCCLTCWENRAEVCLLCLNMSDTLLKPYGETQDNTGQLATLSQPFLVSVGLGSEDGG